MATTTIESINCRGLRDPKKRADFFMKAKEEHVDVLCLQETHLKIDDLTTIKDEWNVNFYIAGRDSNAGGVLIAISDTFEFNIHSVKKDDLGRYIIIDLEITGVARLLLINLYAPNDDSPKFFKDLFGQIEESDTKNLMMIGDWNLVLNQEKDTLNYKRQNNLKANRVVLDEMDKLDLIDIWRDRHETTKGYTWRQNFYKKMARLDFFLISETLIDLYADSKIKPSYKSDHCPISLKIHISKTEKGKGVWKVNNSLLTDMELTTKIKDEISMTVALQSGLC